MTSLYCLYILVLVISSALGQSRSRLNPTILQDSRDLPQVDGTFGFLYRTEDGIAHGAIGDSNGVIHGRYTYTDPTGLKVNFNYNAGSRRAPGYNYDQQTTPKRPAPQPQPVYEEPQRPTVRDRAPPQSSRQPVYDQQSAQQYEEINDQPQSRPLFPRPRPRPNQPRFTQTQNDVDYGSYSY